MIGIVDDEELQKRRASRIPQPLLEIKFKLVERRNFIPSETVKLNYN